MNEPSTRNVKSATYYLGPENFKYVAAITSDLKDLRKINVASNVLYQVDFKIIPFYLNYFPMDSYKIYPSLMWTTVDGFSTLSYGAPVKNRNTDEAIYFRYGRTDRGINLLDISEMSPKAYKTTIATAHPQDQITLIMQGTVSSEIKGYMYSITTKGSECPVVTEKFIELPADGIFRLTTDMFRGMTSTDTKWYLNLRPVYQSNAVENNWFTFGPFVY